jgi:hypothetical protein
MLYLTVEKGGASTGKTQIPSINEVLQSGKVTRDKGWVSFVNECHRIDTLTLSNFCSKASASAIPTLSRPTDSIKPTKRSSPAC